MLPTSAPLSSLTLERGSAYTGITRGKRLVVRVGQKRALAIAVKGQQIELRWSNAGSHRNRIAQLDEIGRRKFGDHRDLVTWLRRGIDALDDGG